MKYLGIMVIALAACVAADGDWKPVHDKATFMQYHDDCKKESGITDQQTQKVLAGEYPDEKEVHNYVYCVDKKIGVFIEDKGYDIDRVMTQLSAIIGDAEKYRGMVANCIKSSDHGSSPAEWAYHGKVCILNNELVEMIKKSSKTHIS